MLKLSIHADRAFEFYSYRTSILFLEFKKNNGSELQLEQENIRNFLKAVFCSLTV